ncbi:PP2C family protein-serine/threonine phosphatase [Leucobacter sp. UCMA 4100]|uniref:PP2C family protein-serine/threonine phosphatase n=1 Tax=Leucobacter sp. UCMA 4100 TaxID=2810534 RepID=UPI0022EA83FB|nr:PP2C family serine/threonine-protein phosphatase [Leucobacter sp. UCMA 4100]
MTIGFESAIASHVGMIRSNNQDSGFAGSRLFMVADGMGGHAGGDVASALTTRDVASIDTEFFDDPEDAAKALEQRLLEANRMLSRTVTTRTELAGMGTTFCGFLTVGDQLATAHIGDSRLYLYRDGVLTQQSKDHTFVQRLVDSGRITEEEAATHPRRSVLMRVLGDVDSAPEIDTAVLNTRPGDVWLLCSDGLCGYVEDDIIAQILSQRSSLDEAVAQLVDVTLGNGAPDNVTVVLVETVDPAPAEDPGPRFAGSAAKEGGEGVSVDTSPIRRFSKFSGQSRRARKLQPVEESHFEPRVDEYLAELIAETKRQTRKRRLLMLATLVLSIGSLAGLVFVGYQWTQTQYFVGTDGDTVIIYQGVRPQIGSLSLNSEAEDTQIPLEELTGYERSQVERTITAGSLEEARNIVVRLSDGEGGDLSDEPRE